MKLDGYTSVNVEEWEAASEGKAAECVGHDECSASLVCKGPDGWYNIVVQYFDFRRGESQFTLQAAGHPIDAWTADENLPDLRIDGSTSTAHRTGCSPAPRRYVAPDRPAR